MYLNNNQYNKDLHLKGVEYINELRTIMQSLEPQEH